MNDYPHIAGNYALALVQFIELARNPESDLWRIALDDLVSARSDLLGWAEAAQVVPSGWSQVAEDDPACHIQRRYEQEHARA